MPYLPRNIKISCNHRGLTHYGGIYFFQEFLRVLQFRHSVARRLDDFRSRPGYVASVLAARRTYSAAEQAYIAFSQLTDASKMS